MSRFDLFFVILDECNAAMDEAIARSVLEIEPVNSDIDTVDITIHKVTRGTSVDCAAGTS